MDLFVRMFGGRRRRALTNENRALRTALGFYARPSNHRAVRAYREGSIHNMGAVVGANVPITLPSKVEADGGEKARAALARLHYRGEA